MLAICDWSGEAEITGGKMDTNKMLIRHGLQVAPPALAGGASWFPHHFPVRPSLGAAGMLEGVLFSARSGDAALPLVCLCLHAFIFWSEYMQMPHWSPQSKGELPPSASTITVVHSSSPPASVHISPLFSFLCVQTLGWWLWEPALLCHRDLRRNGTVNYQTHGYNSTWKRVKVAHSSSGVPGQPKYHALCQMWCRIREIHVASMCLITSVCRKTKQYRLRCACVITQNGRTGGLTQYLHKDRVHLHADRGNYPVLILLSKPLAWFVLTDLGDLRTGAVIRHDAVRSRLAERLELHRNQWAVCTGRWNQVKKLPVQNKKCVESSLYVALYMVTHNQSLGMDAISLGVLFNEFQRAHVFSLAAFSPPHLPRTELVACISAFWMTIVRTVAVLELDRRTCGKRGATLALCSAPLWRGGCREWCQSLLA